MLDEEQQTLFRQLSVFRGGFTLAACSAVMGMENEFDALDSLGELVDKSLVRTTPSDDETRYYLLETLRQYAAARSGPDEVSEVGGRHAQYFLQVAEEGAMQLHGPEQIGWLSRLETEHDNFRAVLAWSLESADADLAQRTATALSWFWLIRRHVSEGVDWFDKALALDGGSPQVRAALLVQSGFVGSVLSQDDFEGCLAQIREGEKLFLELGDYQGMATAQTNEAVILWYQRDLEGSAARFTELQAAFRANGYDWGDAFCSFFLGSISGFEADLSLAKERYSRSLEMFRKLGDLGLIAWILVPLGNIVLALGDTELSSKLHEEALAMMTDLGDRHGMGAIMLAMGMSADLRGDTAEAERLLIDAQRHLREGGGGQGVSWPISNSMIINGTEEQLRDAADRYQHSLESPPDQWTKMLFADRDAWLARTSTSS